MPEFPYGLQPKICIIENCSHKSLAKGLCATHYSRWRLHGDPNILLKGADGTGSISRYFYISKNGVQKPEHIFIAEKALGRRLPKGAQVHHVDFNPLNNDPKNLVICPSQMYHMLLHKRTKRLGYHK